METYIYGADVLNHESAAVTMTRKGRVRPVQSVFQLLECLMDRGIASAPLMDPRNPNSGYLFGHNHKMPITLVP